MPPKAKYTREEIVETAFRMAREKGIESVVARELGKELGTSSSPIFTAFKNMEELQEEVRKRAMSEFESYIGDATDYTPAFKYVGMRMVEFATKEPKLFQLLFLSSKDGDKGYSILLNKLGSFMSFCVDIIQKEHDITKEEAELLFQQTWLHTFAICVLVAGKICTLSLEEISHMLSIEFQGTLMLIKSGGYSEIQVRKLK